MKVKNYHSEGGVLLLFLLTLLFSLLQNGCSEQSPSFKEEHKEGLSSADAIANAQDGDAIANDKDNYTDNSNDLGKNNSKFASLEQDFESTKAVSKSLHFYLNDRQIEQEIEMSFEKESQSISYQQANRPQHTELFAQGSNGRETVETFTQSSNSSGLLDILIVVDNSGSMAEEQHNLSTKLEPLLQYVSGSDWRIGVVTTDPAQGCLRALINKGDHNYKTAYRNAIMAGTNGTGYEQGILQAVNGLKGACNNKSFLRPNSTVAVLIVSDEDNCSNGGDCRNQDYASADYLLNYLDSIREVSVNARVYGLIWHSSQASWQCPTAYNQGHIYTDLIDRSGGSYGSICDNDYTATLASISQNISAILETQFALKFEPIPNTLNVYIDGKLINSGYKVTGNVLEFTNPPADGSTIKVDYKYYTDKPQNEFVISKQIAISDLKVYLDGSLTDESKYYYDKNSRKVIFAQAPACREIKIVYQEAVSLKTYFELPDSIEKSSLVISINGTQINVANYEYLSKKRLIHFKHPPIAGSKIDISYNKLVKPSHEYPILLPKDREKTLTVYDSITKDLVKYTIENDTILFDEDEFEESRKITIRHTNSRINNRVIDIRFPISLDSPIKATGDQGNICEQKDIKVIDGTMIDLDKCIFAPNEKVTLDFVIVRNQVLEFAIDDVRLLDPKMSLEWDVKVNGKLTNQYTINNNKVIFEKLDFGAKVTINVKMSASL